MEWYEPVDIWDMFGINSRDEFVTKYVVEGKFHKNVPEDISKSFSTVSYLLAHSYYHLPMFDEAFSKALLIMEMAIKLKAKELNLDLKLPGNKKGVSIDKRLTILINEICLNEELLFLKPDFDRARKIRNNKMHPDRHSFGGILSFADSNIRFFVNIINMLFLEKNELVQIQKRNAELETKLAPFNKGMHILEYQNNRFLIDGFHNVKYAEYENNKLLLINSNPITTKVNEQFVELKYPEPLVITFVNFEINKGSIMGIDLEGKPMSIYSDDKELNLKTYAKYIESLSKISEFDVSSFINTNRNSAFWKMERIIYDNCWDKLV